MSIAEKVKRFLRFELVDPEQGIPMVVQEPEIVALRNEIRHEYERRREERRFFELQWRMNQNFLKMY